jgi:hypothetical protein
MSEAAQTTSLEDMFSAPSPDLNVSSRHPTSTRLAAHAQKAFQRVLTLRRYANHLRLACFVQDVLARLAILSGNVSSQRAELYRNANTWLTEHYKDEIDPKSDYFIFLVQQQLRHHQESTVILSDYVSKAYPALLELNTNVMENFPCLRQDTLVTFFKVML